MDKAGLYYTQKSDPDEECDHVERTSAFDQVIRSLQNTVAHLSEEIARERLHTTSLVARMYDLEGRLAALERTLAAMQGDHK